MRNCQKGLILIHTGDGKGKSMAAFGLALRAAGQDLRVLILQFMKALQDTGEIKALAQCRLPIEIKQFGREGFVQSRACEPLDMYLAHKGFAYFLDAMKNTGNDVIILDEILVAVDFGLLTVDEVCTGLRRKPIDMHVVLTGRNANSDILEMADLITDMREVKHHYQKGITAQIGIEY